MDVDHKEGWAPKNWCFWTVVLEKTLESPLDSKEIKLVSPKGNQSWIFIGSTDAEAEVPILWPPDVKSQLIGKDLDVGKDWRQKKKRVTEDDMVGWMVSLIQCTWTWVLRDGEGQGGLACCSHWDLTVGHKLATEQHCHRRGFKNKSLNAQLPSYTREEASCSEQRNAGGFSGD